MMDAQLYLFEGVMMTILILLIHRLAPQLDQILWQSFFRLQPCNQIRPPNKIRLQAWRGANQMLRLQFWANLIARPLSMNSFVSCPANQTFVIQIFCLQGVILIRLLLSLHRFRFQQCVS
jgi:hypothetical protein